MKKLVIFTLITFFISCSGTKSVTSKPLYEIISEQPTGGAPIQFYEILSEAKEIKMLLNDPNLKNKVKEKDIKESNFVILNAGEMTMNGCSFAVKKAVETKDTLYLTVKKNCPKQSKAIQDVYYYPFCLLKINSKKEIIFK